MNIKSLFFKLFSFTKSLGSLFKPQMDFQKKSLHEVLSDQVYSIDEITESDLLINEFTQVYDKSITSCGSEVFNHWIHSVKNQDQIEAIQQDMETLKASGNVDYVEYCLNKFVGKQKNGDFIRDLWEGFSINHWVINNFYLLFLANLLCCLGLCFLFKTYIALFIILFFVINLAFFVITNRYIAHITSSVGYLLSLCFALKKNPQKNKFEFAAENA